MFIEYPIMFIHIQSIYQPLSFSCETQDQINVGDSPGNESLVWTDM